MTHKEEIIAEYLQHTEILAQTLLDAERQDCIIKRMGKCKDCNGCDKLYPQQFCQDKVASYLEEKV